MKSLLIISTAGVLTCLALVLPANKNGSFMKKDVKTLTNKEIVEFLYTDVFNNRNFGELDQYVSEEFEGPDGANGPDAFKLRITQLTESFPDIKWNVNELIAEGDRVFVYWTVTGTHQNRFLFVEPTGTRIESDGMGIYYFKDNKIVKTIIQTDRLDFLQQLGVIPVDLKTLQK